MIRENERVLAAVNESFLGDNFVCIKLERWVNDLEKQVRMGVRRVVNGCFSERRGGTI